VLDVTPGGLSLEEIAEGISVEEVQKRTEARFRVSPALKTLRV
jgi:acyl CoA:acetate/3-ketoacid CoA transferase beta subunit